MRISDWSSDVCSSDLDGTGPNSSDEITLYLANGASINVTSNNEPSANIGVNSTTGLAVNDILMVCNAEMAAIFQATRSEEHTSELQSLMRISYAVFCLKKKTTAQHHDH